MLEIYCKVNESQRKQLPDIIEDVLRQPDVHNFTKSILTEAFNHDIVDSYHDIEYALHAIRRVVDDTLKSLGCPHKS